MRYTSITALTRGLGAALLAAALTSAAAPAALAQAKPDVRIATATQAGMYYRLGALMAETLYRSGRVDSATAEATSGALENARLLDRGKVTLGAMAANWIPLALDGEKPFQKKIALRTVLPLADGPIFFVTMTDSPVKSVADLKGRRIAVGAKGSGMEQQALAIFAGLGLTFDDIKPVFLAFGAGARALREGKADVQLQCCVPNRSLTELSELADIRVVAMTPKDIADVIKARPVYNRITLEKGAFKGVNEDTTVLNSGNGWMTAASADPETIYTVTKTVIDNIDALSKKAPQFGHVKRHLEAAKTEGAAELAVIAPLHPGAVKAYKEAGYLK